VSFSITISTVLFCLIPIFELRGGLPWAYFNGMNIYEAFFLCVFINSLVGPLVFLFLSTVNKLLIKWKPYERFFNTFVERARKRVHASVEKYGYLGLAIFVGIPLPVTGAYTGALGAWILGMNRVKSCIAIAYGVLTAGIVISLVILAGEQTVPFLIKLFTTHVQ
jgi:uncharacterized membrane protein